MLFERMLERQTVCLRTLGGDRATEVKFGRWFRNEKVDVAELIRQATCRVEGLAEGRHVLAIQDTTELNYQAHAGRVKGLGTVGNGTDQGLFLHPMLAVDAQDGACLGVAGVHLWLRHVGADRDYQKLPIEQKESYRWLEVAQAAKGTLRAASMVTVVADRESDIYEEWARIPDGQTHLLTRACRDRKLTPGVGLFEYTHRLPLADIYRLEVPARPGKRSAHLAQMEVRFGPVEIKRPWTCRDPNAPASIALDVVDVREHPCSVVGDEEPIHWRLLTTHRVETAEMARQIVEWYRHRWNIEQLFRVLKKQGLDIESSQLEAAQALLKLAVIALTVALKSMQLMLARTGQSAHTAAEVFDETEVAILKVLQGKLEGKTVKQKNPHPLGHLSWAAWLIARLGGWKGYTSESPPGPITMLKGLQRFSALYDGWLLAKDLCID